MSAVFRKELKALLGGLTGWGFFALLLASAGASMFFINVQGGSPLFSENVRWLALGMAAACGLLCADAYPIERRWKTERVLYALPLASRSVYFGKFFARLVVLLMGCALLALYPVVFALAAPAAVMSEGLGCVIALCAMGVLFTAAALACSALSRSGLVALIAYAALVAFCWFAAALAARVASLTALSPMLLVLLPALVGLVAWMISEDVFIGFVAAAVVLAPVLFCHLRGSDAAVYGGIAKGLRACAVFEPLSLTAHGLVDLAAFIYWLSAAALMVVIGLMAAAARRQGKRRAL